MTFLHDVLGIGNAIVDVLADADDAFIARHGLVKGAMTLIDADRVEVLMEAAGVTVERSGGSAGNTIAGVASLGGRAAYIGKVTADRLGRVYADDIRALGVHFETVPLDPAVAGTPSTARSLIIVTPDAQRTMNTYLGACVELSPADVDAPLVAASAVTYLEGYLWDKPAAKEAFVTAAEIAHASGRDVSLTLSDSFCVDRHRESFLDLVAQHIDILFANEAELKALYQTPSLADAVAAVRGRCRVTAVTRSEHGSILLSGDELVEIAAEPIDRLVDTTGAGDLYASGVLFGLTRGLPLGLCGRLGSIAAAEVITHLGPRPQVRLSDLVAPLLRVSA
jgi:sugar/nucleoside kinase (ribokinase family)